MHKYGYNHLYKSWSPYSKEDELDLTIQITNELKSIKKPKSPITAKPKNRHLISFTNPKNDSKKEESAIDYDSLADLTRSYPNIYPKGTSSIEQYKNSIELPNALKDPENHFIEQQTRTELIFQQFLKKSSPALPQFYTISTKEPEQRSYHKDMLDKQKILASYMEEIAKLKLSFKKLIEDDLDLVQDYIAKINREIRTVTQQIMDYVLGAIERRMLREVLNIVSDKSKNAYDKETNDLVARVSRVEWQEIIDYNILFTDLVPPLLYLNQNLDIKSKYLRELNKRKLAEETMSSYKEDFEIKGDFLTYARLFDSQIADLMDPRNGMNPTVASKFKNNIAMREAGLEGMTYEQLRAKRLEEARTGKGRGGVLPPDNVPLFQIGEKSQRAQLYWRLNRLIEHKRINSGHTKTDVINNLILVDKGRYLLTSSTDGTIRLTNAVTEDSRFVINRPHFEGYPTSLCYLSSGAVASGGKMGEIKIFDIFGGREQLHIPGHTGTVHGVAEMPGEALVTVSEDRTMKFWSKLGNEMKSIISPQNRPLRYLKRLNESRVAFSSHRIWIYDVNKDSIIQTFAGHNGYVSAIEIDSKRGNLISSGEDATLRWWRLSSCELIKTIRCSPSRVMDIYENEFLVSGHASGEVKFWDLSMKRLICQKNASVFVDTVRVDKDGNILYGEFNSVVYLKSP